MRLTRALLTPLLCASVVAATLPFPAEALAAPASAEDKAALAQAEDLYKQGKVHFETADYEQALVAWKKAYSLLPDTEDAHVVKHAIVYNISEAEVKAYEVNRNPTHLRKAKVLLERYLAEHRALYGDDKKAVKERAEVRDRLAEVDAMIAESESKGEQGRPIAEPTTAPPPSNGPTTTAPPPGGNAGAAPMPVVEPAVMPEGLTPEQQRKWEVEHTPELKKKLDKARSNVVGGIVMLGIGAIFGGVGLWSTLNWSAARNCVDDPNDPFDDCSLSGLSSAFWGGMALGFGVPGLLLLGGGGASLGVGLGRRNKLLKPTSTGNLRLMPHGTLAPYAGPEGGGAAFTLRF